MGKRAEPARCSIQRAADLIGDRWTLLILREALFGRTRFSDFQKHLGVAPDVLSAKLVKLVDEGLLQREAYQEPGTRERYEYRLTPTGQALHPIIAALGQWGDAVRPVAGGTAPMFSDSATGAAVRLAFVTTGGEVVDPLEVSVRRGEPARKG
jgi:DNA-binding HxlR family transcriptional regulator